MVYMLWRSTAKEGVDGKIKEPVNEDINGKIKRNDGFGSVRDGGRTHYGTDYGSPEGTEVHASAARS